jgi:hypothetical protein
MNLNLKNVYAGGKILSRISDCHEAWQVLFLGDFLDFFVILSEALPL